MSKPEKKPTFFENFAMTVTYFAGSAKAFIVAISFILLWAISGPFFDFSQTWQIIVNTGTTICTFLMVFLIQHSQNKDSLSTHLKLNELIKATEEASNRLIEAEELTQEELRVFKKYYEIKGNIYKKKKGIEDSATKKDDDKKHDDEGDDEKHD